MQFFLKKDLPNPVAHAIITKLSDTDSDKEKNPGVAKFGIALEWGSRGAEFESQHSDQKKAL